MWRPGADHGQKRVSGEPTTQKKGLTKGPLQKGGHCACSAHKGFAAARAQRPPNTLRQASRLAIIRIKQLEPGRALELARRIVAGGGVDVALAGLAQEPALERHPAFGRHLLAVLLDEDAADR